MTRDPAIFGIARQRLPLPHLMSKIGDGAHTIKGAACPFCSSKGGKWAVFEKNNKWLFKCHHPGCTANENDYGHNEIAYLALRENLDLKAASRRFLELAVPDILERQQQEAAAKKGEAKPPEEPKKVIEFTPPGEPPPPPKKGGNDRGNRPPPANPWQSLWTKLVLNSSDRAKLKVRRGFSERTIDTLGFRSNQRANKIHLENLAQEFSVEALLNEGIYVADRAIGHKPNAQLLGWGITNKKDDKGQRAWEWTDPPLIPYLSEEHEAYYIRPHKGGVAKPRDEDDDTFCSSHVYCPFLISDLNGAFDGTVVLCEGEFKAAALYQCGIAAIAIPGVTFVRNPIFRAELLDLLRRFAVTDLIVCFDNEVKDDPKFADKYKPDPWDRWDTPMWAEYIAIDLQREYFASIKGSVRIGILPDELRENGKADLDGVLAGFVARHGLEEGTLQARRLFQTVIEEARPRQQARELFPSESRRIIECKLQRLFYKPLVESGGDREGKLATRLQQIDSDLAAALRSVVGCYYERKPDKNTISADLKVAKAAKEKVTDARAANVNGSVLRQLRLEETAAWERVKGLPKPISDFVLTCDFKLHTSDGKAIRLVKIRNRSDSGKVDSSLIRLAGSEMARLANFRQWGYDTGKAVWKGSEKDLQNLAEDMDHHSYYRDIYEVNYYGYHRDSKLWFFGDCAFGPNGETIEADANNIFWYGGIGYQVDSTVDERGTTFEQGAPLLLAPQDGKAKEFPIDQLFHELSVDMFDTIGDYDAWLALGLLFAYAAAPELLKKGGHPGLWMFGKMSGGKTTIARWLLRIWGFKDLGGVGIDQRTTHVGMNRFLAQYSDLPVWFDEYRNAQIDPQKESVVRGAFDRNSGAKGMADNSNRTRSAKIHTTPIITGESSSSDAATRSRYGHVNVNDKRRLGDGAARYVKMQSDCRHYYKLGRFLMEHRSKFVDEMLGTLEEWMAAPSVRERILNERVRFVYGTAFSAFSAAATLAKSIPEQQRMDAFTKFLYGHGEQALQDVISETFLTRFWLDVISGIQRSKVKKHFFALRYVTKDEEGVLHMASKGDEDSIYVCYIAPGPVYDEYAQDMRSRGDNPPLNGGDLKREMGKEPYWIPLPKGGPRVHRIQLNGSKTSAWVISLERDGDKPESPYIFPYAEDLIDTLTPKADDV